MKEFETYTVWLTAKTIASNGFIDPLDIEKQVDEASGYKCTVTDNTK